MVITLFLFGDRLVAMVMAGKVGDGIPVEVTKTGGGLVVAIETGLAREVWMSARRANAALSFSRI